MRRARAARPNVLVGLVAGACCALGIACAAARAPSQMPSPPASSSAAPSTMGGMAPQDHPGDPHAEIQRLSAEIDQQRDTLALAAPAPMPAGACIPPACDATPMGEIPTSATCHHGTSESCQDSCKLSDSICGDAQKICDLAQELAGDTWAAGKCSGAKQTCNDAHGKCCACVP